MHSQDESGPRPDVLACVGENVRRMRLAAGLSQAALAQACGLSRRMVVAIESGSANISLSNLDRLAAALGTSFSAIVRPAEAEDSTRIGRLLWQGPDAESQGILLGTVSATSEAEMWVWSLAPGADYLADVSVAGGWSEMLFVVAGVLGVEMDGDHRRVPAGDYLIFRRPGPYRFMNDSGEVVRFIRNIVM